MPKGQYTQVPTQYDSAEWTQAAETNYDVSAQTLFVNCKNPTYVSIRVDNTTTVRFNSTTSPAVTVSANTAYEVDLQVNKMYLTTTVPTAVKILFTE